jgi:hypothetical protein
MLLFFLVGAPVAIASWRRFDKFYYYYDTVELIFAGEACNKTFHNDSHNPTADRVP